MKKNKYKALGLLIGLFVLGGVGNASASTTFSFGTNIGIASSHNYVTYYIVGTSGYSPSYGDGGLLLIDYPISTVGGSVANWDGYIPPQPHSKDHVLLFACDISPCAHQVGTWPNVTIDYSNVIEVQTAFIGANAGSSFSPDTFDWEGFLATQFEYLGAITRFISISVATSTRTVTTTGYINADDIATGVQYSLNIATPIYSTWDQQLLTATTSGSFSYSYQYTGSFSSTTIENFIFTANLSVLTGNPFNEADAYQILDTISTSTYAGLAGGCTGSCIPTGYNINAGVAENCIPSFWGNQFSLGKCIQYLVYPSPELASQDLNHIRQTLLSKAPIGYISRFIDILTASTTVPIPTISYTFQADSPFSGMNFSFDVNTVMANAGTLISEMKSNGSNPKTAWDILSPLIKVFLALILLYGMIHDITGLKLIHHHK